MAQLIAWLAGAGARSVDGTPVSSGTAWFYEIGGGTTDATVYDDAEGTIIATQPVALDAAGRAIVYTGGPVRLVVQDFTGATVLDVDSANVVSAESVQVDNANWTGDYLDEVLTAIGASTGGVDAQYMESGGATPRAISAKFAELSISVKDFGAKGDGLAIDTTAVQAAVNRAGFLGGGEVYFPPGNYLIDQPIVASVSNVSMRGAGASSQITNTSGIGDLFHLIGVQRIGLRSLYLTQSSGASTGIAVKLTTCGKVILSSVSIDSHSFGVAATSSDMTIENSTIIGNLSDAAALPVKLTDSSAFVSGGVLQGGTLGGIAFYAGSLSSTMVGTFIGGTIGVTFDSALTGSGFKFVGNRLPATPFVFSAATIPGGFYQAGNGVNGSTITVATAATAAAPDFSLGPEVTINASSGGAGTVTLPNPVLLPPTTARHFIVYFKFVNGAGGAVTWSLGTAYKVASIPTTDGHTIVVGFMWDGLTSKLREISLVDLAT